MINVAKFPQSVGSTGVMFSSCFWEKFFRNSCSSETLMTSSTSLTSAFTSTENTEASHDPKLLLLYLLCGSHTRITLKSQLVLRLPSLTDLTVSIVPQNSLLDLFSYLMICRLFYLFGEFSNLHHMEAFCWCGSLLTD